MMTMMTMMSPFLSRRLAAERSLFWRAAGKQVSRGARASGEESTGDRSERCTTTDEAGGRRARVQKQKLA
jgi:hypothetical protein